MSDNRIRFRPTGGRVLVKECGVDPKDGYARMGEVIAVGSPQVFSDGTSTPSQVQCGDIVAFSPYTGTKVDIDGEVYTVMSEIMIMGVTGRRA